MRLAYPLLRFSPTSRFMSSSLHVLFGPSTVAVVCSQDFFYFLISILLPLHFFILLSFFFSFSTPPPTSSLHPPLTHIQLSNGFDHYSPTSSPYQHSNGGSSGSATAFPFFPTPSSPSTSSPTRSWPRPASALLPDYPPYCTLGPMIPSSKVPSWKVCLLTSVDFSPIQRQSVLFLQLQCCAISH